MNMPAISFGQSFALSSPVVRLPRVRFADYSTAIAKRPVACLSTLYLQAQ